MALLVTGAAGFIGSHFVEHLLQESAERIIAIDDFCDFYSPRRKRCNVLEFAAHDRVHMIEMSFCDPSAVSELFRAYPIDAVVHLGAHAGVRSSFLDPLRYESTNVGGTWRLLEAAQKARCRRFVFVSSSTVYGLDAPTPFCEDQPLGTPASPYGFTKRAAELLVSMYQRVFSLPTVIVRPFSVYGSRLRPDLALTVFGEALLEGQPLTVFGNGKVRRAFTHVADVCCGIHAALDRPEAVGEAINLGSDTAITINDVIADLAGQLGTSARIDYQEPAVGDVPETCADLTKARRLLRFEPRVSWQDGLRDFAAWISKRAESAGLLRMY